MAITKFKISRATQRATLEIATVPYVLNQEYSIVQQSQLVARITGIGVPYDSFGYKLGNDNGIWSEEFNCTINAQADDGTPLCSDINLDIKMYEITNISSSFVLDVNTDRIRFTGPELPIYGTLIINGINLEINKIYSRYEFFNINWIAFYGGLEPNVQTIIKYQVGNINEWSAECDITLTSTANLQGSIFGLTNIDL